MNHIAAAIHELESRHRSLNSAIETLRSIEGQPSGSRIFSIGGRARIAAAQRKRWAEFRAAKLGTK